MRHANGNGHPAAGSATAAILEKAADGERIADDEAIALLESRDLVPIGRVANGHCSCSRDTSCFLSSRRVLSEKPVPILPT